MAATVLVVDDSEVARDGMRRVLEHSDLGLTVLDASDGSEALTLALDGEVDIVVSDVVMPNLDGVQLLRAIRKRHDAEALPVILVTGQADHGTRMMSFEAGVNDYLYKPFAPEELVSRIQVQLRLRRLQEDLRATTDRQRRLGTHDGLTGLANRRHFLDVARRELARSRRHNFNLSLAVVDIDRLREANARWGYLVGDAIISELGSFLTSLLRSHDVLARVAGGKCGVLLPQTNITESRVVCDRLRDAVRTHPFPNHEAGDISVSVGSATYPGGHIESAEELLDAAEASLDQAKSKGSNRVELWSEIDDREPQRR